MSNNLKHYDLFIGNWGCKIFHKIRDYQPGMWTVRVAAFSIKQAYYLCSKQIWKTEQGEPGIIQLHTNRGSKTWKEKLNDIQGTL